MGSQPAQKDGDPAAAPRPASVRRDVLRVCRDGADVRHLDPVAAEEPLELRLWRRSIAVTMRTPGDDVELVTGFLLTEGVIEDAADIAAIDASEPNAVDVQLAPGVVVDLASLQRNLFASSSCGVCGKASIEGVLRRATPLPAGPTVERATLVGLPDTMRRGQHAFAETGGLHAAAIFDVQGAPLCVREDVGRHNAVDKAVGALLRASDGAHARMAILLVSGRASFEIVQKAIFARIPIVCAVSAPSSLAVDAALEANLTLVGFLRGAEFNVYAHPERLR